MKKTLASLLVVALSISLLTVSAAAKTTYDYKPYTFTDYLGDTFTFSAASTGYDLHVMEGEDSDKKTRYSLVILKPGSTVTIQKGSGHDSDSNYIETIQSWGFIGENQIGDVGDLALMDIQYGTMAVERIYDLHCKEYGYDIEDTLAVANIGGSSVCFVMEGAAERHSDMVTPAGETPEITRYQSTAKLTRGIIADLVFNDFGLTITNPTDGQDSGTIALVLASYLGTVHFVDYSLAPKESKTYSVAVAGHMAIDGGHSLELLNGGWGAFLNADIITFESDEDLASYRVAIPYEQNLTWMVTQGALDGESAGVVVCNGALGDSWLKNYTGIQRHGKPTLDPAVSHNICQAGGR